MLGEWHVTKSTAYLDDQCSEDMSKDKRKACDWLCKLLCDLMDKNTLHVVFTWTIYTNIHKKVTSYDLFGEPTFIN